MTTFNWLTFLEGAIEKEPDEESFYDAKLRASDWPTCACGELCKELPTTKSKPEPQNCLHLKTKIYDYHWTTGD